LENTLEIFTFENSAKVRTIIENGKPWFVAKDVAAALEYAPTTIQSNIRNLVGHIPNEWRGNKPICTPGGTQQMQCLTEEGLNFFVVRSDKPKAFPFQKWLSGEVLPSIRKHGFYGTDDFVEIALTDPDKMISILQTYKFEKQKRVLAEQQRDEAIKTKAWIGSKREATAMATASVKSKENEKLKEQVGDSRTYKQVKAIPWLGDVFDLKKPAIYSQIGRHLSKISVQLGYACKEIPNTEYGTVKAYHIDVIDHFRHKLMGDLNMMKRYRSAA